MWPERGRPRREAAGKGCATVQDSRQAASTLRLGRLWASPQIARLGSGLSPAEGGRCFSLTLSVLLSGWGPPAKRPASPLWPSFLVFEALMIVWSEKVTSPLSY